MYYYRTTFKKEFNLCLHPLFHSFGKQVVMDVSMGFSCYVEVKRTVKDTFYMKY